MVNQNDGAVVDNTIRILLHLVNEKCACQGVLTGSMKNGVSRIIHHHDGEDGNPIVMGSFFSIKEKGCHRCILWTSKGWKRDL